MKVKKPNLVLAKVYALVVKSPSVHLKLIYLQIRREWVRQPHVPRKSRQYQVSHLDAIGRDDVTEAVMVIAEEFWEIVKQNQENPKCSSIKPVHRFGQFRVTQKWRQELEEVDEQLRIHGPSLLARGLSETPTQKDAMRYDFEPGVSETGSFGEPQDVKHVAIRSQNL